MPRDYRLIDADAHILEPKDLWESHLPQKYRDRAPYIVKDSQGGDAWQFERDQPPEAIGLIATPGLRYEDVRWEGYTYETIRRSCWDPHARLEDLDFDGVDAQIIYPYPMMAGFFMAEEDAAFQRIGLQTYNDWLHDEYCAVDHERLVGLAQMPNLGVADAVTELERCAKKGMAGAILAAWPSGGDNLSEEDDAFWAAAEKLGVPISVHIGVQRRNAPPGTAGRGKDTGRRNVAMLGIAGMTQFPIILSQIIFGGVLERFPKLKLVGTEVGVGWIPALLEQMDDKYWRNRTWAEVQLRDLPSEYFHRSVLCTFIVDRYGVKNRHEIGVRNMMWSTDFPHHGNDWPYSRKVIADMFDGVPEEEKRLITCANARALYGLSRIGARERVAAGVA